MKKNATKKALLLSVLSLLLCVSMLVGTTYAWFTDTVTSANNKIVAGTLEVDLLMADAAGDYASIADETAAIFGAGSLAQNNAAETLWEPGKTQIVYLGVENKGNLDLKYNILLNVIDGGLIGSLEYAVIDGANAKTAPVTADNWAAIKAAAQTGDIVSGTTVAAPNGAIKAGENAIDYFALAVHMKEDAGNEYQGKDITIDVTVAATQLASEEDSFGPDYDEMATFLNQDAEGNWEIGNAAELTYFAASVNGGKTYKGETVKLTADVDLKGYSWIAPDKFAGTFEGNGKTISNLTVKGESNVGFFKRISSTAKIQNVTFDKANMSGNHYVGVVVGWEGNESANALIKNVKVTNSTVTCTVADNDNGDKVGGIVGYAVSLNIEDCAVENSTITGYRDVGGILGYAHKRAVVKNNTVKDSTVICDASVNYKNYTKADEYDVEPIVGEAVATAVIVDNTATNVNVVAPNNVASVGTAADLQQMLTDLTSSGAGDNVLNITSDINIGSAQWNSVTVQGYTGADVITVNGNGHTITGLNAPLFTGGFAGGSGIIINDLTIENAAIEDTTNDQGVGAFISCVDSMDVITLKNCHLLDSEIKSTGGARVGGLVGWTSGYNNQNDGPVDTKVTITNCSVVDCTIEACGSVGAIIGHAGSNPATYHTIENCVVTGNTLTSYDDGYRVGVVVGTANVGEVTINNITESNNTLKQINGSTETARPAGQSNLYGRAVLGSTGKLTIDGVAIN